MGWGNKIMRLHYYKVLKDYADKRIRLYDIFSITWSDFIFPSGYTYHIVTKAESDRPYLIASLYFNNPSMIEEILLVNKIPNFLELKSGTQLKIPVLSDLEEFRVKQFIPFESQFKNELS
jgi:hypothetical protein